MTDLTKDEVSAVAQKAGCAWLHEPLAQRFATLCRAPLVAENAALKADLEQTRVQLAGCGVAAMQNTEESKANRVERGAYGWSESYGDVCRMVDSEIELRAENVRLKDDYQHACKTVAEMHAAAVGQIVGPNRGVVEDVADLRTERDDWKARALKAEQAGKYICPVRTVADLVNNLKLMDQTLPIYGAQYIEHLGKSRCIATPPTVSRERIKDSRWIGEGDTLNAAVIWTRAEQPPQPAAQEPTSAVPVVEQLVDALSRNRIMAADSDGNYTREVTPMIITAAIAAGQKYLKENGDA